MTRVRDNSGRRKKERRAHIKKKRDKSKGDEIRGDGVRDDETIPHTQKKRDEPIAAKREGRGGKGGRSEWGRGGGG